MKKRVVQLQIEVKKLLFATMMLVPILLRQLYLMLFGISKN